MKKDKARRHDKDHDQVNDAERRPASSDIDDAKELSDDEFKKYSKKARPDMQPNQTAHVIAGSQQGPGVEIIINRGEIDGIMSGDQGIVVGLDKRFKIGTVREKSCVGFVEKTSFELLKMHKTVVLNPT